MHKPTASLIVLSFGLLCTVSAVQAGAAADVLKQVTKPAATDPSSLSETDAGSGIKEALAQGVGNAINRLGKTDGFLADQAVRILIPKKVRKLTEAARKLGADKLVDDFEVSMNRAAEQALPAAAEVFSDAVRQMSLQDALGIVRGGEDAGTQYFRRVTEDQLRTRFLPIVSTATGASGATRNFKKLNKKAGGLGGLLNRGDKPFDLDSYVTDQAMNGLFHYIAEEEKNIRKNPLGQASSLLRRVFGR
ncbi:MAG: DUF4197 domain-containing protein [Lysobacterales bacterium]